MDGRIDWRRVLQLEAGPAAEMGRDSLVLGVTFIATLYAVLLPSPWTALMAPVAFVAILEVFERARRPASWSRPRDATTWLRRPSPGSRSARVIYVIWGMVALLVWLLIPAWAALIYVPWLATLPWLPAYLLLHYRLTRRLSRPPGRPAPPSSM